MRDGVPPVVSLAIAIAFVAILVLIVTWDAYVLWYLGREYTVSYTIGYWATRYPILAFALGVLTGHVFWGRSSPAP